MALGQPTQVVFSTTGDHWDYLSEDKGHCVRYEGDKCAEHPKNKETVYFTPAGHMKWDHSGAGCYTQPFFGYALHEVL